MEPKKITYNDHTLFHLLRHFESLNDAARACLWNRGYRENTIQEAIKMPGSKFYASFANDIKSLEQQLCLGQMKDSFVQNGYLHDNLEFDQSLFPKGIGSLGIAAINDLKAMGITKFEWKQNRGLELCHAKMNTLPSTNSMTLVLKYQKNYQLLITAFPGYGVLPVPNKGMSAPFFQECELFWQNHAFLELA